MLIVLGLLIVAAAVVFAVPSLRNEVLGKNSSPNGTAGAPGPQQFVSDAEANLSIVAQEVGNGGLSTTNLISAGYGACNTMSSAIQTGASTQGAYSQTLTDIGDLPVKSNGTLYVLFGTTHETEVFAEYAFRDLCPMLSSDIPYGDPGWPS